MNALICRDPCAHADSECAAASTGPASAQYIAMQDGVVEGVTMVWIVIPVLVLVVGGAIAFLLGPTIMTFFGPDFEPAPKDDASVENATMTRMVDGGQ
jgi:hypothetical protein